MPDQPDVETLLGRVVSALGGEHRAGQSAMAQAVARAARDGEHLLVQAGTGTGKSVAYLVPLVEHAVRTGTCAVVSTATLALQAQVVDRDLPRVADALAPLLGRRPTFGLVKGRSNYVCRHKLTGGFPADDEGLFSLPSEPSRLGREVTRLRDWAQSTATGDRDELVPGVGERAWRQVSVSAHECLGAQACPQAGSCFSENARHRARGVDVVVTNHALSAIDAFEGRSILPEHAIMVVDEAHDLADRVTSVVSDELTATTVEVAARRAARQDGGGTEQLVDAAGALAGALEQVAEGRFATGIPEPVLSALVLVRDAARQAVGGLKDSGDKAAPQDAGARQVARASVVEVFEVAERLVAQSASDVVWVSEHQQRGKVLHVAPLTVAFMLRDRLFATRTVVATSATLSLGGTFDACAQSFGLLAAGSAEGGGALPPAESAEQASGAGAGVPRWRGMDVGSPFDYRRQAILYIASDLPPPGRDGPSTALLDRLAELIAAAGGRTLGLFSSRRMAEAAAEAMRRRLDVPVLCQGDDATPTLVRSFARTAPTCLFGTLSLWQGVDVPGPACQLVVIDRIPFPRPDDPLASARARAVDEAGGNGFMRVSATHAALRLAQGAGRLVRSADDRGVVAVLDQRLHTRRYGDFLLRSLPPFWRTTRLETVLAALRRIDRSAGPVWAVTDPVPRVGALSVPPSPPSSRRGVVGGHPVFVDGG